MDLDYYRNFIAIVEAGSISQAAKRLNIAQPALSNQLKILNRFYGTTLLNIQRGGHSIELTDAGSILFNKAKYICSMEQSAQREITDCNAGFTGTLRISLSPSMSISFIKSYLTRFSELYPHINYELYESSFDEQMKQLLNGETEIGVANAPLPQPFRFETILRRRERLQAVFNKNSRFLEDNRQRNNILLEDLEDLPLCLSRGCATLFLDICSDSRIYPQVLSVTTTKMSALAWVEKDCGVAIVPVTPEESLPENLVVKEIQDERLYLEKTLSVVKNRPLSTVAKIFIQFVMENFADSHL